MVIKIIAAILAGVSMILLTFVVLIGIAFLISFLINYSLYIFPFLGLFLIGFIGWLSFSEWFEERLYDVQKFWWKRTTAQDHPINRHYAASSDELQCSASQRPRLISYDDRNT